MPGQLIRTGRLTRIIALPVKPNANFVEYRWMYATVPDVAPNNFSGVDEQIPDAHRGKYRLDRYPERSHIV